MDLMLHRTADLPPFPGPWGTSNGILFQEVIGQFPKINQYFLFCRGLSGLQILLATDQLLLAN